MSKKVDKNKLDEIFFEDIEEIIKTNETEDLEEEIKKENPKDLKDFVLGIIEQTHELIGMVKNEITEGHFESDDQKTSLFDSASRLIENLNRTTSTLVQREQNIMKDDVDKQKLKLLERRVVLEENKKSLSISAGEVDGQPALEQKNYFYVGKLGDLVKDIQNEQKELPQAIDITPEKS